MSLKPLAAAAAALALAACASVPTPRAAPALACASADDGAACAAAIAALNARSAAELRSDPAWSMQGRAAVSHGSQGGSVRVEWVDAGYARDTVTISVPVTRQSWRLDMEPGRATLQGAAQGPTSGPDAAALLRAVTGWELPVEALRYWLRGLPAPGAAVMQYRFDAGSGRLAGLRQSGWDIDYLALGDDGLPRQLTAVRDVDKVKLVVDAWGSGAP